MKFTFPPESKPLDGYTIKRAVHRGGFGEVYYALSDAGKEVALKLLQQNLEIELRGVRQCLNLKHPNLVTIFDIRTDGDGDHWIVMEYVHGKSLDRVIAEHNGPMPLEDVEQWLAGMTEGLAFLHDRGIVHRDLKPANVFLENGVVKVGDVGLSKFIRQSKRSAQTESVGTVYYMAPEVARGRYGHEVDVYSLGIVLYEMLTGRVPFDGESTAEILMKHLSDKPDLSPLPKRLRPVIGETLEKDPLKRTSRVQNVLQNFRKAVAGIEIPTAIPDDSFIDDSFTEGDSSPGNDRESVGHQPDDGPLSEPERRRRVPHAGVHYVTGNDADDLPRDGKLDKLHHKAFKHERIEARKAARHARKEERKQKRHARKMERKVRKQQHKLQRKAVKNGVPDDGRRAQPVFRAAAPATDSSPQGAVESPSGGTQRNGSQRSDRVAQALKIAAIVVVLLAVVMPRTFVALMQALVKLALLGGIGYGMYWLITKLIRRGAPLRAAAPVTGRSHPPQTVPVKNRESNPVGPPQAPSNPKTAVGSVAVNYKPANLGRPPKQSRRAALATPEFRREMTSRTRLMQLSGSLLFAVFATAVVSAAIVVLSPVIDTPSRIALFAAVSLLAAWAVLATAKWYEGTGVRSAKRRVMTMLVGVLVGASAFGVDEFLLVRFTQADYSQARADSLVRAIGNVELVRALQPTLIGYVAFFAGLLLFRRWWCHADSFRRKRVAVGSILLTTLVGLVWSLVVAFPLMWGVTWAAAISSIVHLSAVWISPEQRRAMPASAPTTKAAGLRPGECRVADERGTAKTVEAGHG